jgi:predicted GIY-YIG superfamily endonuclease
MAQSKFQDDLAYPPRAMKSDRAAAYLDMSRSKFLELVDRGWLPAPTIVDGIEIWDPSRLDSAFNGSSVDEEPVATALYRHFDSDGRLLYVGISLNVVARLSEHCKTSHWFGSITRIDVERFRSRQAALAAERKAIRTEKPLHNIAGRVAA